MKIVNKVDPIPEPCNMNRLITHINNHISPTFSNWFLSVFALRQLNLPGRLSMRSSSVMWITVTVSSAPPTYALSNRCWMQLPAWSFTNNNLIVLRHPYVTSCTGFRFYRGTTINSVYSSINAYIGQRR